VENTLGNPPFLLERPLNEVAGSVPSEAMSVRKRIDRTRAARLHRSLWASAVALQLVNIREGYRDWARLFHFRNNRMHCYCVRNRTQSRSLSRLDLLSRASTGVPKIPTVIDRAWETGRAAIFKIKNQKEFGGCHALAKRNRACARKATTGNACF
jgi:hypothetical protein